MASKIYSLTDFKRDFSPYLVWTIDVVLLKYIMLETSAQMRYQGDDYELVAKKLCPDVYRLTAVKIEVASKA